MQKSVYRLIEAGCTRFYLVIHSVELIRSYYFQEKSIITGISLSLGTHIIILLLVEQILTWIMHQDKNSRQQMIYLVLTIKYIFHHLYMDCTLSLRAFEDSCMVALS